ncbi:ATP-binding protein [Kordiimonas pumila]|uniref:ATP-binding protein n=1 Tax=Kordiimonas pumila TaxID=2161677 RepID=A0ABV7D3P8_9PROT|nr:ATP-binding protein [Kordiimonas pumila]
MAKDHNKSDGEQAHNLDENPKLSKAGNLVEHVKSIIKELYNDNRVQAFDQLNEIANFVGNGSDYSQDAIIELREGLKMLRNDNLTLSERKRISKSINSAKKAWLKYYFTSVKYGRIKDNEWVLNAYIKKYGKKVNPFETVNEEKHWLRANNDTFIPFVGREKEMSALTDFISIETQKNFQMWAIVGPSGAGKTRLMVHWGNSGVLDKWRVINVDQYRQPDLTNIDQPTLITIDYIYGYEDLIAAILSCARDGDFVHPVRLLLLDHATPDHMEDLLKGPRFDYGGTQLADSGIVEENYFFKDEPLKLLVTENKQGDQFLADIISGVCKYPPDHVEIQKGVAYLKDTIGARQPLFAALVGDAILNNLSFVSGDRRELIAGFLQHRHRITWRMDQREYVNLSYRKGAWAACFIAAATARRGADYRVLVDCIPDGFEDAKKQIMQDLMDFKALCAGVVSGETETHLKAFEPDILGESHFLLLLQEIKSNLWDFDRVLLALIVEGERSVAEQSAVQFVAFMTRLARNLTNDDQSLMETQQHWDAIETFLTPERFPENSPFRWAVASACFELAEILEEKKVEE